ncbi:MAG: DUF4097 family beta strand repeat protein [Gammaproteobacteria bacterium]|nr:DUF4097 family beta strand repeat protein [Gammaproteobacteria bacterium]MBU1554273.1 DUF4097 family beta strand repeat protein [Gammaproteobacteria bacterium]MBU2069768.1 DUF4097 family beta strand repeat protein [Gammaproteobacteria bacterium]MBU2184633.1 DUF4097 family beta strand repeat protein [Gammaproteobacteria bacterium]MBU2205701.1 DUF4097 family beta strand repeat protein [Gammaproteobacteria bacterium]
MNTLSKKWLTGVAALLLLHAGLPAYADQRESVNESRAVAANEKIYLEVMSGEVSIKAVDGNQFKISGKLDEKATGYTLESKDGFTRFEMTMPRQVNYRGSEKSNGADLQVEVPSGSSIEFKGVNSDVSLAGVTGGSKISTVNGNISAAKLSVLVQLNTVNGEINSKDSSGDIELSSVNGKIIDVGSAGRLNYSVVNGEIKARTSAEEVNVSTVNGDAELKMTGTQHLKLSTVNGEIEAELAKSASPRISGSSVSGDIELKLDSSINARFDIQASAGGGINNKLSSDKASKAKYGPARSLQFTLGSGNGSVDLSTVSGDVTLGKL